MVNPDRNLYDPPYDDALLYDNEMEPERPRSRSLIVMLAFVVLAAFAGVVWVAYNQGVQQGQRGGNPPLLSADAGPTRVEPDQTSTTPSANPAPEKSYERLWAANGEQSGAQENVMPGAEQPRNVPTTQEIASAPVPKPPQAASGKGGPLESPSPVDPRMDSTVDLTNQVESGSVQAPQFTAPSLSKEPRQPRGREDITAMIPDSETMDTPVPTAPAPSVSRPTVKQTQPSAPRSIAPAAPAPIVAPIQDVSEPTQLQSSPSDAPATAAAPASGGKASIQLGSFPSSKLAADQWSKVKGANQELLGSYSPQIVEATIPGKGVWYRLRVGGFTDKSAAKAVCDQLSASGQACIIAGK
ncbi:MAG: SPOR domain-containing protein [Micropepsaceae bacterium]